MNGAPLFRSGKRRKNDVWATSPDPVPNPHSSQKGRDEWGTAFSVRQEKEKRCVGHQPPGTIVIVSCLDSLPFIFHRAFGPPSTLKKHEHYGAPARVSNERGATMFE
jgi:hypothetical protein